MIDNNVLIVFPTQKAPKNLVSGPMDLQKILERIDGLGFDDVYVEHNGKKVAQHQLIENGIIRVFPRLPGGKGGFGSMLRAIGAQIEKTTNREACRDLSGRRLRDINEEKRLKTWISQQADREKDAAERKRQRLERLVAVPKVEFNDAQYEASRSEMTEKVADAVEQGFKMASEINKDTNTKRPGPSKSNSGPAKKKKKTCLWVGSDEDELSSSLDTDSDDSVTEKPSTSTSSNNITLQEVNKKDEEEKCEAVN